MRDPKIIAREHAKAREWGICERAARKIIRTGYSEEAQQLLANQARRWAENRRMHRQDGDYRKKRSEI
jgi:hypothetical protein